MNDNTNGLGKAMKRSERGEKGTTVDVCETL
jgi:hypothetical protein